MDNSHERPTGASLIVGINSFPLLQSTRPGQDMSLDNDAEQFWKPVSVVKTVTFGKKLKELKQFSS